MGWSKKRIQYETAFDSALALRRPRGRRARPEAAGLTLQDMELMADMMAHTVSTAHNIYIKNVDNDSSDECSE